MNDAEKLHQDYLDKLKLLQGTCEHREVTDWMQLFYERSFSGKEVKDCKNCGKTLETRQAELKR